MFSNDVVCLAVAPVLIDTCSQRRLDPTPFLLALACAANAGSAATLIGNPQNMLIGQTLQLSFTGYLARAAAPTALALVAVWAVIALQSRGRWGSSGERAERRLGASEVAPSFDRWQTAKGVGVAAALLVVFLASDWPREIAALAGAGVLLTSRRLHSRETLGLVDWQFLVLFIGLFVVNGALEQTGLPARPSLRCARAASIRSTPPGCSHRRCCSAMRSRTCRR